MTFVSLTDASHHLGIDAKTMHRWLQEAQLPLQNHPRDGRKKGVSQEPLQLLARLHQRHLVCSEQEAPAPLPCQTSAWPSDLLLLPEQLCALQTQMAALQQPVADLTRLLQQPVHPTAPAQPTSTARPPKKPTPPVSRSRRATAAEAKTKTPQKPVHVIPRVEYGEQGHYVVICPKRGVLPIRPDTPEWFAWVAEQDSFRFVGKLGYFTAHHEWRVPRGAWRAHRQIRNHSYTQRLALSQKLTLAVLEQAAEALQAHLASSHTWFGFISSHACLAFSELLNFRDWLRPPFSKRCATVVRERVSILRAGRAVFRLLPL